MVYIKGHKTRMGLNSCLYLSMHRKKAVLFTLVSGDVFRWGKTWGRWSGDHRAGRQRIGLIIAFKKNTLFSIMRLVHLPSRNRQEGYDQLQTLLEPIQTLGSAGSNYLSVAEPYHFWHILGSEACSCDSRIAVDLRVLL